jgi:tetratricopeptide (TPR) repeat protein
MVCICARLHSHSTDHSLYGYLGDTYNNIKQWPSAVSAYLSALKLKPGDSKLHVHLADTYSNLRWHVQALHHHQKALALNPKESSALVGVLHDKQQLAEWSEWPALMQNITKLIERTVTLAQADVDTDSDNAKPNNNKKHESGPVASLISPYQSLFLPLSAAQQRAVAESWARETVRTARSTAKYESDAPYHRKFGAGAQRELDAGRKLKIGYLSRRFEEYPGLTDHSFHLFHALCCAFGVFL